MCDLKNEPWISVTERMPDPGQFCELMGADGVYPYLAEYEPINRHGPVQHDYPWRLWDCPEPGMVYRAASVITHWRKVGDLA